MGARKVAVQLVSRLILGKVDTLKSVCVSQASLMHDLLAPKARPV